MEYLVLGYEVVDSVAVITMNHPPANAMGPEFLEELRDILRRLYEERNARAVLIRSACPGFFSAGDDVSLLKDIGDELISRVPEVHELLNDIEYLPLPTIAAINGHALGGGLELALACDFRFMADGGGLIGLPEVRLGMIPSFGGTQRLPQIVGRAKAIEMMFKGLQLSPQEAREIGLVNDVFPCEDLEQRSFDYALRLARQAVGAMGRIKRCIITGYREGFDAGLSMEFKAFKENIRSQDAREGIDAFLSGRKPMFKDLW